MPHRRTQASRSTLPIQQTGRLPPTPRQKTKGRKHDTANSTQQWIEHTCPPIHAQLQNHEPTSEKTLWARLTYYGRETRAITKVFKNTKIKVTYSTRNTLKKLLMGKHHHHPQQSKYEIFGIYQITCPTCNMKYTGQTGRSFNTHFQEHLRDFKNGYGKSRFAQHLLENRHAIDRMNDIMDTIYFTNKGRLMDTVENFYIFRETKLNNQINDRLTVKHIIILETIVRDDPHRGIHDTCNTPQ
jgi:hypothetical protein